MRFKVMVFSSCHFSSKEKKSTKRKQQNRNRVVGKNGVMRVWMKKKDKVSRCEMREMRDVSK
jgi:hypothetical protein